MVVHPSLFPRMGLGMAALGRPGYINLDRTTVFGTPEDRSIAAMQEKANTVLTQLFQLASESDCLPWIDCARSYGLSEKFVGEYLRTHNIAPDQVHVSSKWGYTYVADFQVALPPGAPHEVKDHSTENFLRQLQETNDYLGEYIDLYQIHSATFESGILTDTRVHRALMQCRRERGWLIGLSVSSPQQSDIIEEALKIQVDGTRLFDSVQCTFNALEQGPASALLHAHQAGVDIIIKEGMANGRALRHPKILQYSSQLGCQPDELCLACILAQPFVPRVLSGAVTPHQLKSNWKSQKLAKELPSPLVKEIMASTVMASESYWMERAALAWN